MKTTIEITPRYRIAYIRKIGPYGVNNIKTMEELKTWAREKTLLNDDSIILGIAHDNPSVTKAEDCRYDTCIVISDGYMFEDPNVHKGEITGGKYLVFEIEHTADAVQKTLENIFNKIGNKEFCMDISRPVLERYAANMIAHHLCEICIPIY